MADFFRDPDAPVQPDQFAVEFAELLDIYKSIGPKRVLEIGVRGGGTLYQWIKHAEPGGEFTAVDIGTDGHWSNRNMLDPIQWCDWAREYGHTMTPIIGDSHAPTTLIQVAAHAPFDFVFIDADHTYFGVACDFLAYGQMVRSGGIVALHDILRDYTDGMIDIWRYWPHIQAAYPTKELVSEPDQKSRGIGVVYV